QNSASNIVRPSALERVGDRLGDPLFGRRDTDEPLDDRYRGPGGNVLYIEHGRRALVGDNLLGLGDAGIERRIQRLAAFFRLLSRALAGLIGERLGPAAG